MHKILLVKRMFDMDDALYVASIMNVKFDRFTLEEFLDGINIELEHGKVNSETNVTNDNLVLTAKIALAHLREFPNYYNKRYGLRAFEEFLKNKLWDGFVFLFLLCYF